MCFLEEITLIATFIGILTILLRRLKLQVVPGLVLSLALVKPHGFFWPKT